MSNFRIVLLTACALVAFAANSVLCRMALIEGNIDPATFTTVRVLSGLVVLVLLLAIRTGGRPTFSRNWTAGGALFAYMVFFSFAYVALDAGIGALILFGFVQITMLGSAVMRREPFPPVAWLGFVVSVLGVVYLVSPGVTAPDAMAAAYMAIAGVAWGAYSLFGRGSSDPLADTASNFLLCVPAVLVIGAVFCASSTINVTGLLLAMASGALASGAGYAVWYAVLPYLRASQAGVLQLAVPVIAAAAGVLLLGEAVTLRILVASLFVIGGIGLVLWSRDRGQHQSRPFE